MGFGWAYVNCPSSVGSGSAGPAYSLQFVTESGGATTGSALLSYYTASVYSYNPSTLVLSGNFVATGSATIETGLTVTGALQLQGLMMNATTITNDLTIPGNHNAVIYGPITVAAGKTITVSADGNFKIKDIADA